MMLSHGRKGSTAAMRIGHSGMAVKPASGKAKSDRVFGRARKQPEMFRVGLYARVSTNDQQTIPLQVRAPAGIRRPAGLDYRAAGEGGRQRCIRTTTSGEVAGVGAPP